MLKVLTPKLAAGAQVKVVGNHPLLGQWDTAEAPLMTHGASIPLAAYDVPDSISAGTEYKFVIIDADGNVTWETGDNRRIGQRGPLAFRGLDRWKGTGVAVPVFSLRSDDDFGCGDFLDLKDMGRWAAERGMSLVQILPVNDTTMTRTYRDSYPYNANSSFALHPMYLRIEEIGRIDDAEYSRQKAELNALPEVDYERVVRLKEKYLHRLYQQQGLPSDDAFAAFMVRNHQWLLPYAAYSVIRDNKGTPDFRQWGDEARFSTQLVAKMLMNPATAHDMGYYFFVQYHLDRQLRQAVDFCHSLGVGIKGDIPIGISPDSADAWQYPDLFNLSMQAGAPPDDFAWEGQNWGFPTYNWPAMAADGYCWWRRRLSNMAQYFDAYRIDHVLGFFRIWEIPQHSIYGTLGHFSPATPLTPEEMERNYGFRFEAYMVSPGKDTQGYATQRQAADAGRDDLLPLFADVLFVADPHTAGAYHPRIAGYETEQFARLSPSQQQAYRQLHEDFFYRRHDDLWRENAEKRLPPLIDSSHMLACAEDLGMIPACVPSVLDSLQILSLEVQRMPKEFGAKEGHPLRYPYLSVATTSTHDMPPLRLWWMQTHGGEDPSPEQCRQVIGLHRNAPSMLTVLPIQDWLAADGSMRRSDPTEEQINIPSNPRHYWRYRLHTTLH